MLDIVRSGKIGEPRWFTSSFSMHAKPGGIRTKRELGGGTLYDLGVYCINTARLMFGAEPTQVFASSIDGARSNMPEIDEMTAGLLRFDGDRLATFTTSFNANGVSDFRVVGTDKTIPLTEVAKAFYAPMGPLTDRMGIGLEAQGNYSTNPPNHPNGSHVCEVEVDPETGAVHISRYASVDDVGRCINPLIVHGQTHGGIAQGVGQAMWELCHIDPSTGQPLSGSFMDYGMPHGHTLPSFKCEIVEVLSPTNPLGVKAGGEGGTTPALAVIISAVADALRDLGIHDLPMPATPFAIWQAIQNAKSKTEKAA